jgi:glyoxylase-like metal-dependent hydrolase (beta-lactamase superfamily II)
LLNHGSLGDNFNLRQRIPYSQEHLTMINRRHLLQTALVGSATAAMPAFALAKAPMLGIKPASVHRYKFGAFEMTAASDGQVTLDKPWTVFGENQKPETVQALAKQYNLPTEKHTISFTPLIVNTGNELVLFDTGWGSNNPGRGQMSANLAAAGYTLDQIDVVVLTHYHPDHMGGLMDGDKPVFPNARYVFPEGEQNFWTAEAQNAGGTKDFYDLTRAKVMPLAAKATFVKDGGSVVSGITALSTPGHTPGHTSYRVESEGKQLIVTGDTCNHSILSLERPKWHVLFDMDKDKATATRLKLLDMIAKDRIAVVGYHMPFPAVGYIYRHNGSEPRYHWEAVTYAFTE